MEEKNKIRGKKARAQGKLFESKVRKNLEKCGWTICKWVNQVDLKNNKIIPAKSQYNPFLKRIIGEGSGFPDFIAFKRIMIADTGIASYEIIGVECKGGDEKHKYLNAEEKQKCIWYLENRIFNSIMIAQKGLKRGEIILNEF